MLHNIAPIRWSTLASLSATACSFCCLTSSSGCGGTDAANLCQLHEHCMSNADLSCPQLCAPRAGHTSLAGGSQRPGWARWMLQTLRQPHFIQTSDMPCQHFLAITQCRPLHHIYKQPCGARQRGHTCTSWVTARQRLALPCQLLSAIHVCLACMCVHRRWRQP